MVEGKPLELIYWARFVLAIVAAVFCVLFNLKDFSGIATGIILYLASCLLFQRLVITRSYAVMNVRKIYTTGVGVYFLTWITAWLMLYTILSPSA